MTIQKLNTSRSVATRSTYVGEKGRLFYDETDGILYLSDGQTAGGILIGGGGSGGNYTLPTASATVKGGVKVDGTTITITNQIISATQLDLSGYATLTGEETLTNKTLTSPTITDGVFQHTFSIGNQIFYEHGYNGFSVNEDFDIVGEGNFTGYHYTSGAGRDGVAFTLARTGQFTTGFGIHGTAESNEYVIGSETANTDFVFKSSIGMPFDVSGGTELLRISNTGTVTARTSSLARLAWNSAIDTELTVDDYRFRISNQTGIFPQIISNTGGTKNTAWTAVGAISGDAVKQDGSTGNLVPNNSWVSLYTLHGMDSPGDTVTVTLQDKQNGRIYRVTFMGSDDGSTTGYNIIAESLL